MAAKRGKGRKGKETSDKSKKSCNSFIKPRLVFLNFLLIVLNFPQHLDI